MLDGPEIAAGSGFTVTAWVVVPPWVYVTVVTPAERPVNTPPVEIVPTAMLLLLHVPPEAELANVVVEPTHTVNVPVIGG